MGTQTPRVWLPSLAMRRLKSHGPCHWLEVLIHPGKEVGDGNMLIDTLYGGPQEGSWALQMLITWHLTQREADREMRTSIHRKVCHWRRRWGRQPQQWRWLRGRIFWKRFNGGQTKVQWTILYASLKIFPVSWAETNGVDVGLTTREFCCLTFTL
jgi:hypothetical protein